MAGESCPDGSSRRGSSVSSRRGRNAQSNSGSARGNAQSRRRAQKSAEQAPFDRHTGAGQKTTPQKQSRSTSAAMSAPAWRARSVADTEEADRRDHTHSDIPLATAFCILAMESRRPLSTVVLNSFALRPKFACSTTKLNREYFHTQTPLTTGSKLSTGDIGQET